MTVETIEKESLAVDKTARVVDYLSALAKINAKIIRTFEEYRKVLWIHSVPMEPKYCFTQAWGPESEQDDDVWLEVIKCKEPEFPKLPVNCAEWVDQDTLKNIDDIPKLKESISVEGIEEDSETGETYITAETFYLSDFQSIADEWDEYLSEKWLPWKDLYLRYAAVQKVYAELFHIYQEQQKLGEQYELVFCNGLLSWKAPSGHGTQRHIITAKVTLQFEPHLGRFTVKPAVDGEHVEVELDMLDIQDHPQNIRQLIESGKESIGADFWNRFDVDSVLSAVANSLADSGQGEYLRDNLRPEASSKSQKPVIEFAPALILRKRSSKGLEQLLASIKEQVENGGEVPDQFLDLCESLPATDVAEDVNDTATVFTPPEEIYFPLPANEEQRQIIRTLDYQKGVLVQGPPGTGKSHTIANLICHLLATGKRVLVTAKTPRALKVLHEKLPKELRPLCINLLGQGGEERESLARSVAGILKRLDEGGRTKDSEKIQDLKGRINSNRREKAATERRLTQLREAEITEHILVGGKYKGTAAKIARELLKVAEEYKWFTDTIDSNSDIPINDDEIQQLCWLLLRYDQTLEKELKLYIPNKLPDAQKVRAGFRKELETKEKLRLAGERLNTQSVKFLINSGKGSVNKVFKELGDFYALCQTVRRRPLKWVEGAIADVLTDRDTPWKERLRISSEKSSKLHNLVITADRIDVLLPTNTDKKQILHSAKVLKEHYDGGGRNGFLGIKPKVIREHWPSLDGVKIDGLVCDCSDILGKLIEYLTVVLELDYIWSIWADISERHNGPFPLQLAEIDELNEALKSVIDLYDQRNLIKDSLQTINGLWDPRWADSASVEMLLDDCRIALNAIKHEAINKRLTDIEEYLSDRAGRDDAHPITVSLADAFRNRNAEAYTECFQIATKLLESVKNVDTKNRLIGRLAKVAPNLARNCASVNDREIWANRLKQLDEVWAWAQATSWLENFLNTDIESLERHVKNLDDKIRIDIAELASLKAWRFCFRRMKDDHRRHLMAWQNSMKKLGKGTGKHAPTHRRNAQEHLNQCREAVPAWIMPLHRVYESVSAGAGIFDVIIVDEASQCGPEGLPLMYLGKRILVVGDDKQISPEAVGIDKAQIQQLMQIHLKGFDYADSFDVDSSLFDHGRIRFSNRISLREHFRCMPEIIQFSNDLCYREAPLIPLRQFPPDRLSPLKAIAVENGYREGSHTRVVNRPEADAVVEAIVKCCADDRYQGMTMGVIVLQGEAQAYLIQDMLLDRLGAEEFENRRLLCGNSYSFQGDERDVIFLSMVAAPNERIGALTKEADQRRFNVAASRAQEQMWLFYSVTINDLSDQCYRKRLLEYFLDPTSQIKRALGEDADKLRLKAHQADRRIEHAPTPFDSWFEVDVALQIAGEGYRVVPQFQFADKRIDLVIQGEKSQLAVECDGDFWHGPDAYKADMERQRKLERCGWQFFRIRESCYYSGPELALQPLWTLLENMGIFPQQYSLESSGTSKDNVAGLDEDEIDEELDGIIEDLQEISIDVETETEVGDFISDENDCQQCEISTETIDGFPATSQEALSVKPAVIRKCIIQILKERPNNSCVKSQMPKYILSMWKVITRGTPREKFTKRVNEQLAYMDRKGHVFIYKKSKNVRVKLGRVDYPMD